MAKKTAAADVDDLLAGKTSKKPAAKKPAADKPAAGKTSKKAAAADDVLEGKKSKGKAAPAKKQRAEPTSGEEVRAALLKCKKLTTYSQVAEAGGFDIRSVRRNARALRDEGQLEFVKEGTVIFFKVAGK